MRVGIIGAGFYGITIGLALEKAGHSVDIYEKNAEPMLGASLYNQHRLHLGFHYPRCDLTINQAKNTFDKFLSEYKDATFEIPANYYLNHKNSAISGQEFCSKMEQHELEFETTLCPKQILNPSEYDFACVVPERGINTEKFREMVLCNLIKSNCKLFCNSETEIDLIKDKYDYVISCTYVDPGAYWDISTKAELAVLLLCRSDDSWNNKAITIMDGPFCSIYPANGNTHTISSVVFTPAIKAAHPEILKKIGQNLSEDEWEKIENDIWDHAAKYVDLTGLEKIGRYKTIKTKIQDDKNDFRGTAILGDGNVISVVGGKLSGAYIAAENILKKME